MDDTLPSAAPSKLRPSAEIIGVIMGFLALLANELTRTLPVQRPFFLAQIGSILGLAALAALVATQLIRWTEVHRLRASGVGAHLGLRAGLVAGLVAGAACCASALVHTRLVNYADEESAEQVRLWATFFVSVAGVLPSACVGLVVGGLSATLRECAPDGKVQLPDPGVSEMPRSGKHPWLTKAIGWFAVLGMALPLLSLVLSAKPPRPIPPEPVAEVAPPWRYDKPAGLAEASPLQFTLVARKPLPELQPGAPLSISPDGNWLAYCASNQVGVSLLDLTTALHVSDTLLPGNPTGWAWSSDSTRLIIRTAADEGKTRLHMYVRESGALLLLPRPQSGDIPNGPMVWPLGDEVIFYPDDEPPLRYDLGQLRLFPLSTSEKFKPEDEWTKQAKLSFPSSDAWQFEAAEWIYQVTPSPRRNPQLAPKAEFDEVIALSRPGFPVRRTFPDLTLFPGITCVPALDASKCILTQKDKGEVFYFGIVKPQAAFYTLDLPEAQAIPDSKKTLAETLSGNTLCAVVYAPMVNPLTGRTIGPDREQPKGLLRFIGWESKTATFYVASAYDLFQPQDVVADIHEWKDGRFLLSTLQPDPFWWTALSQGGNEGKIPIGAKPLPLNWTLSPLSSGDRWFVFLDYSKDKSTGGSPPPASLLPPPEIEAGDDEKSGLQRVREFAMAHHDNTSSGDIARIAQDYAAEVDYLGKTKTVEEIAAEERENHQRWSFVSERIVTPIKVETQGAEFVLSYSVEYRTEDAAGVWISGMNDVVLGVKAVGDSFQIVRQSAKLYEKKTGNLKSEVMVKPPPVASPPKIRPISVSVPKPRWMMSVRSPGDPTLQITDVLHLSGNQFILHRTFRRLSSDGKSLLAECRAKYDGGFRSNGRQISLYLGSQGWEKGGDSQLLRLVAPQVERMVGRHLELSLEADGSITVAGAGRMTQIK